LFLLTLVALLPAAMAMFYNFYAIQAARDDEIHSAAEQTAQLTALELERIVNGAENVLIALSVAPSVQAQDSAACLSYLTAAGARLPQFSSLAVTDKQGMITCSLREDIIGTSIGNRPYFQQAMRKGTFTLGGYMVGRLTKEPMLPMALPILGDDGQTSGAIVGGLSLNWLRQRMGERDFAKNRTLSIVDSTGIVIARVPEAPGYVGGEISARFKALLAAGQPGTMTTVGRDGVERIYAYYPAAPNLAPGLFVTAGISTEEAYAAIHEAGSIGLVIIIASLLLSFVLAWITSAELIRRPVRTLTSTIAAWRAGNEAARTGMSETSGELGIVGKAIDGFLSELVAARRAAAGAEERRELLVHELDHRIKNLLATVQSVARQTLKSDGTGDETVKVFTRRLNALSEAHGLLMRDNGQSAGMRDMVESAIRPFAGDKAMQFTVRGPNFQVKAKGVLSISMALHELCTNAVKYGALGTSAGKITIEWSIDCEGEAEKEALRLVWTESDGPPVTAPDKLGFGSKMIERVLGYELEADVETSYAEGGLVFTLTTSMSRVRLAPAAAAP
jgi:two-component sensor histidine kinase